MKTEHRRRCGGVAASTTADQGTQPLGVSTCVADTLGGRAERRPTDSADWMVMGAVIIAAMVLIWLPK